MNERRLLVKVSRLYYEHELTQNQIGQQLRISRQKVQRLLQRARDEGIVYIRIEPITGVYSDLEKQLENRFGLIEALVVETTAFDDQATISRELGTGAAEYLARAIKPGDKIVISNWSRAINEMVNALRFSPPPAARDALVIQGLSELAYPDTGFEPGDLTRNLARALRGRKLLIPAPVIAENQVARDAFYADPNVAHVLDQARAADMAFMGIGAVGPEPAPPWEMDIVSSAELSQLAGNGAVGEVNLRYFDASGLPVSSSLDARVVGITLDEIKRIRCTVCVAGGAEKCEAVAGALNGKLADVLITDHITAQRLV